jgi:hypothetical protein
MESVPGAIATGWQLIARLDIGAIFYPVAIAPGTDLICNHLRSELNVNQQKKVS